MSFNIRFLTELGKLKFEPRKEKINIPGLKQNKIHMLLELLDMINKRREEVF